MKERDREGCVCGGREREREQKRRWKEEQYHKKNGHYLLYGFGDIDQTDSKTM